MTERLPKPPLPDVRAEEPSEDLRSFANAAGRESTVIITEKQKSAKEYSGISIA